MMMTKVAAATGTTRFKFARRNVKGDSALLSVMSLGGEIVPETSQGVSLSFDSIQILASLHKRGSPKNRDIDCRIALEYFRLIKFQVTSYSHD